MEHLLCITLAAPTLAALLVLFSPNAKAARIIAAVGSAIALAASLLLFSKFDTAVSGFQFERDYAWISQLGLSLHVGVDGISLGLLLLTTFVGFCAILASDDITERSKSYYALMLVMIAATAAAFVSLNLFFFYFFAEVATLPKYLLTGIWGRNASGGGRSKGFAAMQQTIFIGGGALVALVGLVALYFVGGHTLDITVLAKNVAASPVAAEWQRWIFGALLFGFGTWVSIVPFHAWSPAAYAAAPTGAAMFFAGVSKKLGAYAIIRVGITLLPAGAQAWAAPLAILAAINIIYGGFVAMRQREWQPLIGYSSVSHAGYMFLGIAALTTTALNGVVLFMVAHGLMTALLFAMAGSVARQTGTREIKTGGFARVLPFTAILMTFGVMASAGVPGFANFVSELMIFIGSWQAGTTVMKVATIAAIWGLVITATYLLRALRDTFFGPLPEKFAGKKEDLSLAVKAASIALVVALLVLGFQPRLLTDGIKTALGTFQSLEQTAPKTSNDGKVLGPVQGSPAVRPSLQNALTSGLQREEVAGGAR